MVDPIPKKFGFEGGWVHTCTALAHESLVQSVKYILVCRSTKQSKDSAHGYSGSSTPQLSATARSGFGSVLTTSAYLPECRLMVRLGHGVSVQAKSLGTCSPAVSSESTQCRLSHIWQQGPVMFI